MQAGRHGSSAPGSGGPQFYHPRGVGVGKATSSGSSSSSLVSGKVCIQISRRAILKLLPLVWIWKPHPIPHPMTWGNFCTSTSQARLLCADCFLELTVVSPHPPGFPLYLWSPTGTSTTTCAYSIPIPGTIEIFFLTFSGFSSDGCPSLGPELNLDVRDSQISVA